MSSLLTTVLVAAVILGVAFAGIATRILLVKDGEFRGTCASNNPYLKDELGTCTVCGKEVGSCENETVSTAAPTLS